MMLLDRFNFFRGRKLWSVPTRPRACCRFENLNDSSPILGLTWVLYPLGIFTWIMKLQKTFFRACIHAVANARSDISDVELEQLAKAFRKSFLRQGFNTYDNKECMNHIAVGRTVDGTDLRQPIIGYLFPDLGLNLTDVMNTAEGCAIPDEVRESYPNLTQGHWDATLRMATMFFVTLQGEAVKRDRCDGAD